MNYPVTTSLQLRAVLRALRQSRALSQTQVGHLLGVSQKRIAAIENAPGVTGFDQMARLVAALGGRLVIEAADVRPAASADNPSGRASRKTAVSVKVRNLGNW
ncbi:MAG: helix-turn-helix domain-containing protein [Opitutus sp.]|nr:helix-turn-helix domain-containing protein [Opitutus sp.]